MTYSLTSLGFYKWRKRMDKETKLLLAMAMIDVIGLAVKLLLTLLFK